MRRAATLFWRVLSFAAAGSTGSRSRRPTRTRATRNSRSTRPTRKKMQGVHDRAVLHLAARRLPAGVEDGADAAGRARRRRRRAGQAALLAEVYQYMRMVEKASPRVKVYSIGKTEEGREMIAVAVSSEANLAKLDENRARLAKLADPRTIEHERRRGRQARRSVGAGLLHHRRDSLAGNRLADGADGARLPPRGRREPVHPEDPQPHRHADHAGRRGRRPRPPGRHLPLAPRQSRTSTGRRSSTGASTSRTTTTATRWR